MTIHTVKEDGSICSDDAKSSLDLDVIRCVPKVKDLSKVKAGDMPGQQSDEPALIWPQLSFLAVMLCTDEQLIVWQ